MSEVTPRLVLCVLGRADQFDLLRRKIQASIDRIAKDFSIDDEFSSAEADDRMPRAFEVCWDRLPPATHDAADEAAVEGHGCVIYVLSPSMQSGTHVDVCAQALALIEAMFAQGAIAVKGESAGNAHGKAHWLTLAREASAAQHAGDRLALTRVCRIAFAHRPLSSQGWLESVGYHLVGLPELSIDDDLGEQIPLTQMMDRIADYLAAHGVEATVNAVEGELDPDSSYDEDDLKFNPYGTLYVRALPDALSEPAHEPESKTARKKLFGLF